ncbi:sodium/proline symporter PutP [Alteromonas sp. a30]|uniref:sodium/proline symporter PutP n=1 Tax=Alteromonas sp. a30 TaxID=2730917 RepID=UPI002280F064|nr:sodium/proline symporter PutP [Alteromonas sp. a30]MCY7295876.1 sodium/proline symporter PutP [Alteromonas sp. a30]
MDTYTLISLAIYFIAMLGIGLYSYKQSDADVAGFLLAGRKVSPKVTALSAGASDMSGWMLMGLPGAMYISGMSSAWIALGLVIGAFLNYILVAPRLRVYTELADALTIPDYFEHRFQDNSHTLRIISSIVIVLFFTLYTSSGVVAGGKLFESAFAMDYYSGLYITTGVVVAYTLFGGFMAVSMTDFVQGCIMFIALILVPVVAISSMDGVSPMMQQIESINPDMLSIFSGMSIVAIISSMSWGLGYFGQPHIIVRFMAIRSEKVIPTARRIGMTWMIVSIIGALGVGLTGVAYINMNQLQLGDPETIFIYFSQVLFHPLITGFLLAAILAAIMSTISSQLLVTSSSLAGDLYHRFLRKKASQKELLFMSRLSVVIVAGVAIALAHDRSSSILSLVSNAWAGFGAAFGPLILLSLFWKKMTRASAIAGMISGAITVLIWIYLPLEIAGKTLSAHMYEMVPGFIISTLMILLVSKISATPTSEVMQRHDEVEKRLQD